MATGTTPVSDTECLRLRSSKTILLLIDLQQSFTVGSWKHMVTSPPDGVNAIIKAFQQCSLLLRSIPPSQLLILSQCPFWLSSDYSLDPQVSCFLNKKEHKRVVKPGNSILDASGFESHVDSLLLADPEIDTIVIGGCTLTSCVRVSSGAVRRKYSDKLSVVVSLELCGARDANYKQRCMACFRKYMDRVELGECGECDREGGDKMSPVDRAVRDMRDAGCVVVPRVHIEE